MQTDATLLANNTQQCWELLALVASVCMGLYRASSGHRRGFLLVIGRKLGRLCFAPYQRPRNFIGVMEPRSRFPCDVREFKISTALILACFRMYEDQNQNNSWLSRLLFKEKTCSHESYRQDSTKA